jgi:radical SAM superfamily enzyme YgiQ (UPF0313 family)
VSHRTPEQITDFITEQQHRMDAPFSVYGDEPNSYRKHWDDVVVRMLTFACWPYEQAAGNQAIPLVYKTVNEHNDALCDRWYFPATPRDLKAYESAGIPVFGIESRHQMRDFDIVGTSISYPVLTINFLKQLQMADIPPSWDDLELEDGRKIAGRKRNPEEWPFVVVGGQAFGAPEVLANIADAVFCGEAEDEVDNPGLVSVVEAIRDFKMSGEWSTDREGCYRTLAREFRFLYFPRFYEVNYAYEQRQTIDRVLGESSKPSKQVVSVVSTLEGMPAPVVKRFVHDLDAVAPLSNPPLLYNDPGLGAGDLETQRGCPAWCSFCALTYRQKPYRQRSIDYMLKFAEELLKNTGGLHVSPFGPDFPMHTQKKALIKALLENVVDDIDASSMRVDDFIADPSYINLQAMGGMDTVTLGVEGNSQRMRDLVGKGASDESVLEAVALALRAGIRRIKLYMIAFIPGEDEGDIYRLLVLARKIAQARDAVGSTARIQFSWTPMLIEGNTPFQWFAPTTINFALGDVWEELRELHIDFKLGGKAQKDKMAFFQLSQRASREMGKAMVEAVVSIGSGCWGGAPMKLFETVEDRLFAHGFNNGYADGMDERFKEDMFGWEHIDQGINDELMWVTYQQMREFLENTDSSTYDQNFGDDYLGNEWIERCDTKCYGRTCGVCNKDDLKIRSGYIRGAAEEIQVDLNEVKIIDLRSVAMRVRAAVRKDDGHRFVANSHFAYAFRRAAYRAGVPITTRSVKLASDMIRFKNWSSGVDYVEFGLTKKMTTVELNEAVARMNTELGVSLQIESFATYPAKVEPLRTIVERSLYDLELDVDEDKLLAGLRRWDEADYIKAIIHEKRATGMVRTEVNAKEYVDALWGRRDGHRLKLRFYLRGAVNPYVVYQAFFAKTSWLSAAKYPVVRLGSFITADENEQDFLRPSCAECGRQIPVSPLDVPFDPTYCPPCQDRVDGVMVEVEVVDA